MGRNKEPVFIEPSLKEILVDLKLSKETLGQFVERLIRNSKEYKEYSAKQEELKEFKEWKARQ